MKSTQRLSGVRVWMPILGVILVCGFLLRAYRLGAASLWYDEACQAQAALAPTIQGLFATLRGQVAAMPLDFLVTRVFALAAPTEAALRTPALIWGTLALAVSYHLFSQLIERKVALLATLLLALTPILIGFSQEARYYASLVFFYLLSTDLLLQAIRKPNIRTWPVFTLVVLIGTFFQPFTLLSFFNGFVWILSQKKVRLDLKTRWAPLILSGLIVAGMVLLYIFLGFTTQPFFLKSDRIGLTIGYAVLVGLGWIPPVYTYPGAGWVWGILLFAFFLAGIVFAVRWHFSALVSLAISLLLQVLAIVLADLTIYFPFPRQFIMLLPLAVIFSAVGIFAPLIERRGYQASPIRQVDRYAALGMALIVIAASIPALGEYYSAEKSRASEISQALANRWESGDRVLVISGGDIRLEAITYTYYFETRLNRSDIAASLQNTFWDRLADDTPCPCKTYLITTAGGPSPYLPDSHYELIDRLGYLPVPVGGPDENHGQRLWIKE